MAGHCCSGRAPFRGRFWYSPAASAGANQRCRRSPQQQMLVSGWQHVLKHKGRVKQSTKTEAGVDALSSRWSQKPKSPLKSIFFNSSGESESALPKHQVEIKRVIGYFSLFALFCKLGLWQWPATLLGCQDSAPKHLFTPNASSLVVPWWYRGSEGYFNRVAATCQWQVGQGHWILGQPAAIMIRAPEPGSSDGDRH